MNDKNEDIEKQLQRLEMKFNQLAQDFTELRYEVNNLETKLEKRT